MCQNTTPKAVGERSVGLQGTMAMHKKAFSSTSPRAMGAMSPVHIV